MPLPRRPLLALTALAAVTLLAGCDSVYSLGEGSHRPTSDEVVGTWIHPGPHGLAATIEIRGDGTWSAGGIPTMPECCDGEDPDWTRPIAGQGTWTIPHHDIGQAPEVELEMSRIGVASAAPDDPATPSAPYTLPADQRWGAEGLIVLDVDHGIRLFTIVDLSLMSRFYWDRVDLT